MVIKRANLELHIEDLVLHGFAVANRSQLGEAVEQELTRLFAEQGAPALLMHGDELERLDGGAFSAVPDPKVETTGAQIAQAVYRGLS